MSNESNLFVTISALLALVYLGASGVASITAERACLAAGWRESKVDWTLTRYCITRNDQTDVVKRLSEVRRAQSAR